MSQTPTLTDVIDAFIAQALSSVYTALPGRVVSYDPVKQKASIQPLVDTVYETENGNRTVQQLPVIQGVPVCFPGSGNFSIVFPITAGDSVLLLFASSSIDLWKVNGGRTTPVDGGHHELGDAIAIPGLRSFKQPVGPLGTSGVGMVVAAPYLRLGDANAVGSDHQVVIQSALDYFIAALTTAIATAPATGTAALTALKTALTAGAGWLAGTTKTKAS